MSCMFKNLFGLYYKLIYLCSVIRTQKVGVGLSAGACTETEVKKHLVKHRSPVAS